MIYNIIVGIFIFGVPATILFSSGVLYGLSKIKKLNKENQMGTENRNLSQNIANCDNQENKNLTLSPDEVQIVETLCSLTKDLSEHISKIASENEDEKNALKFYIIAMSTEIILDKIKQWKDENNH